MNDNSRDSDIRDIPDTLFFVPDGQPLCRSYGVQREHGLLPHARCRPGTTARPGEDPEQWWLHDARVQLTHPTGAVYVLGVEHTTSDEAAVMFVRPEITDEYVRVALVDQRGMLLADVAQYVPRPPADADDNPALTS